MSEDYDDYEESTNSNQGSSSFDERDRQNIVEELYNCKKRAKEFIIAVQGSTKQDALAGRKFLKKQYSAITAVINTTNAFTKKLGDDTIKILHRANQAFILDIVNEPTIHRSHYRTLTYAYWHMLELFLGLAKNGHGANVLKDALAGLNTPDEKEEPKKGLLEELRGNKNV